MGLLFAQGFVCAILAWILDIALWKSILLTCIGGVIAMIAVSLFIIEYSERKEWREQKKRMAQKDKE